MNEPVGLYNTAHNILILFRLFLINLQPNKNTSVAYIYNFYSDPILQYDVCSKKGIAECKNFQPHKN